MGIGIGLLYALWVLIPRIGGFAQFIMAQEHESHAIIASQRKLSAPNLEAMLARDTPVTNAQIHCEPAQRDWDYVCTYKAAGLRSQPRLHFGVAVDAMRWVQISPAVPVETAVPPPHQQPAGR
jgi:hypothetical protein